MAHKNSLPRLFTFIAVSALLSGSCSEQASVTGPPTDAADPASGAGTASANATVGTGTLLVADDPSLHTHFTGPFSGLYLDNFNWVASIATGTGGNKFSMGNIELTETCAGDTGHGFMHMTVRANKLEGAELVTFRKRDYQYGRYQARMKASPVPGCVNAFFFKADGRGDEIDVELLTEEFRPGRGMVHFVLHPHVGSNNFHIEYATNFNPSDAFHTYGWIYDHDRIDFTVDGAVVGSLKQSEGAPTMALAGKIWFNVWTGTDIWGGGPPTQDATMVVDWCKFFPEVISGSIR